MPLYPQVKVSLVGRDGNSIAILSRCYRAVQDAIRRGDLPLVKGQQVFREFREEATSGDYDHLLQTVIRYFETC